MKRYKVDTNHDFDLLLYLTKGERSSVFSLDCKGICAILDNVWMWALMASNPSLKFLTVTDTSWKMKEF